MRGGRFTVVMVLSFAVSAALTTLVAAQIASGDGFVFVGGNENEMREGGAGDDDLDGGGGQDFLNGREGDDLISGGDDEDTLFGENAADAAGEDEIYGDAGGDEISGGPGDDDIEGGPGNDLIGEFDFNRVGAGMPGEDGQDILNGNEGDDIINAGPGSDGLFGGPGHDTLNGGPIPDSFEGGPGDDIINGGLVSEPGNDDVSYRNAANGVEVFLEPVVPPGHDEVAPYAIGEGNDQLFSIEDVRGSEFGDVLVGSSKGQQVTGGAGDDHLDALEGVDTVHGGADDDVIRDHEGGSGSEDALYGDSGDDDIRSRNGTPSLDHVFCGSGDDVAIVDIADQVDEDCETVIWPGAERTLTLQTSGGSGSIVGPAVLDGPSLTPVVSCSGHCTASFGDATRINLRPVPAAGFRFVSWGIGPCAAQATPTCQVILDSDAEAVSAVFEALPAGTPPAVQPTPPAKPKPKKKPKKKKPKKKKRRK
jgi:Ca2+-binding RTX toxin-like protein